MADPFPHPDRFADRHIGPDAREAGEMLAALGLHSLDELVAETVPASIRLARPLDLPPPRTEAEVLAALRVLAARNQVFRSYIGMGYSDCFTPPVIQRNVLENPGWYTAYTPYQAEIAQGRLEALLNFQTMVIDLTGLAVANASLLDEGTAAAEAMAMMFHLREDDPRRAFFVSDTCHPQTIAVVKTRAAPIGVEVIVGDPGAVAIDRRFFGALVQYPASDGALHDYRPFIERVHAEGALAAVAADLLALTLLVPPGELGADVAVGSTQRFGVPMGYGGPHAAYFATRAEFTRAMPGRIIGVSQDARGRPALRLALQTREQHIRREKATSNICTAQVLLAVAASMYAVYHGPRGLRAIAERVHGLAVALARGLQRLGHTVKHPLFFDTLRVELPAERAAAVLRAAAERRMNFRRFTEAGSPAIGIALDETTSADDVKEILSVFGGAAEPAPEPAPPFPEPFARSSPYLTHPVFNTHHSETEMLRYLKALESRDLSLAHSMIPLGSCTMKLNATAEMMAITWPEFARLHPFAPVEQAAGYREIFAQLASWLAEIAGLPAVSLQPNAGSQGEYAGLLVIRRYHASRGEGRRDVCLIPASAHGTNPASAAMAGCRIAVVKTAKGGDIDIEDLREKIAAHRERLAALMVTYPSTHGVFEDEIREICALVHGAGGQVYMDGANMNAQVGLCRPGDIGADVVHLNLHKTFCIAHGGGGPGMGPIAVASHLARFLPGHPLVSGAPREARTGTDLFLGGEDAVGAVASAPWGSAEILLISWAYVALMGAEGLKRASQVAILNANYLAQNLSPHYPVLYRGSRGRCAHECIIDPRELKRTAGVEAEEIAKRLMDYGFHAPTLSFPVAGTLMIEPTESEPKAELDRFCEAMISIRAEIREVEEGRQPREDNLLQNAPHTADAVAATEWTHPYPRERAAFPAAWLRPPRGRKFWPPVGRLNNVLGDRRLVCACPPVEEYA